MGEVAKIRGGAGVKLLSYCDGEAPGGRSLCVLNCHKVMEDPHPLAQLPQQIHNQQIRPGSAQSKCVQNMFYKRRPGKKKQHFHLIICIMLLLYGLVLIVGNKIKTYLASVRNCHFLRAFLYSEL